MSRYGRRWTRGELVAVLYLYVSHRDELVSPQNDPKVYALAKAMGRTDASIVMRIANFRSVDPAYPKSGLDSGAGETPFRRLWREYEQDPERVMAEGRIVYREFGLVE